MKHFKLIAPVLIVIFINTVFSQNNNDKSNKSPYDSLGYSKMIDSMMNVYNKNGKKQYNDYVNKSSKQNHGNSLFGVNIDVILGLNFSNTSFDMNKDTAGLGSTGSKTGPSIGANINFRIFGFSLGTGFAYSSKGFKTGNSNSVNANYFNIPLLFAYNFNIKSVEIDLNAGPYLGILLSQDNSSIYPMKNLDIGITGAMQGSFFFNQYLGVLLGVKYEQGGLNNLLKTTGNNNFINSIKTTNWCVYSGMKFNL